MEHAAGTSERKANRFQRSCKFVSAYTHLKSNKKEPLFNFKIQDEDLGRLGVVSLAAAWERESPRPLKTDIHAADAFRVWGANKDGILLYIQIIRRQDRVSEVILHLQMQDEVYQLPIHPCTRVYNTDGKSFSTSGLTFEILEPLRRWTVHFDGYLRRMSDNQVVTATFDFLCTPICNYVSYPEDFNEYLLAKYLSKTILKLSEFYQKLSLDKLVLSNQLHGLINIDGLQEQEVLLRGFKERSFGCLNWKKTNHLAYIEVYMRNATVLGIYIENKQDEVEKFMYGFLCPPCNMTLFQMTKCEIDWDELCSSTFPKQLNIKFTAGQKIYNLKLKSLKPPLKSFLGENHDSVSLIHFCEADLNGREGEGVVHLFSNQSNEAIGNYKAPPIQCSFPFFKELEISICEDLVVAFEDILCRSSSIVGGKGASLALMTAINVHAEFDENFFAVPPGVCVTKSAFEKHIKENPEIQETLTKLQAVALSTEKNISSALQEECAKAMQTITNSQVSNELKEKLEKKLKEKFEEDFETIRFAVRSSAIGEDGEEMSAAGQNETFLGVKGLDQMVDKLRKCWASQFSFRSVEYKRHNGQLLDGGMGVVIQQMVAAEVAGVLFSRHPLTGSVTRMVITANYGLGESVVSASADPDTILIRRGFDDHLAVQEVSTGSKKTLIQMGEGGDTEEIHTEEELTSRCCLSEPMAIRLAKIAIFLEKCFGNGRDIEWAVYQQRVYVLQSRPVTTSSSMTDFDVIHEFNTAFKTDEESHTIANASEVMPGAQTPLSATSVIRGQMPFFQKLFQWKIDLYKFDPIVFDGMGCFYGHPMFNLIYQRGWALNKKKQGIEKAFDIGIYGHVFDDEDITKLAFDRFEIRPTMRQKMGIAWVSVTGMLFGTRMLKETIKQYHDYHLPITGSENAQECYKIIGSHLTKVIPAMRSHIAVTMASTMWNLMTLNILSNGTGEFSNDQYTDFALLVGSANGAESGNVPFSLRELADAIQETADLADFPSTEPQQALEMLLNSKSEMVTKKFQDFLQRHGHRGLKEIDMSGISWGMDPKQVAVILQGMLMTKSGVTATSKVNSWQEIESSLKTPLSPFKKWMLRKIMKFCRASICNREQGKSCVIKCFYAVKLAYRHLAGLMIKEGLILDEELLFFFTHEELGQLIETRSPKLIRRAKQRQKVFPMMDKFKFPEIIYGFPKPVNNESIKFVDDGTAIKGTPVSQGVIQGAARVVKSFHDVHTIKSGEILITHATDIGWSPYFPMLKGIVTEIGGLISHGAVVAREFGLPCIVGVFNATDIFQSGDTVLLNATQGTITKIGKSDDEKTCNKDDEN